MFSKCNIFDPCSAQLEFHLWEITGRWVSKDGATEVYIYRNTIQKWGGFRLSFTYNNPQVVCNCAIKQLFNQRYIDLYGRIGIAYHREREVLHLSVFGEYVRAEE